MSKGRITNEVIAVAATKNKEGMQVDFLFFAIFLLLRLLLPPSSSSRHRGGLLQVLLLAPLRKLLLLVAELGDAVPVAVAVVPSFFFRHRATLRCSPAIAVPCGPHGSPFVASSVAISSSLSFKANFLTPRTAASRALANAVPSSFRSSFLIHSIFLSSNNASQAEVGKVSFSLSLSFFFDLFFFITERN